MFIGLMWGIFFYSFALIMSLLLYRLYSPWYKIILPIIFLSYIGHFIATIAYALIPTDSSVQFFPGATPHYIGLSTGFVKNLVWYVREYLTDDSYVGTLYFFSAFAFLGSVLWYLLFLQSSQLLNMENQTYVFPAVILMCWPSFLFFTTGIGKDSLVFFFLPLIFLSWNSLRYKQYNIGIHLSILLVSILFSILLRPYLLLIYAGAYYFSYFFKFRITSLLWLILLIPVGWCVWNFVWSVSDGSLDSSSIAAIGEKAIMQQEFQNTGTSFPILSHNPIMLLLTLPYSFIMNLFFPLFLFAHNLIGIIASFENCYLISLVCLFWKRRITYQLLKTKLSSLTLLFSFFVLGMAFMSLINTNLGLSTRQKSMYVPPFLVLIMLVWLYDKSQRMLTK